MWDLPTRLFHWALVLCFVGSIASVKIGGNAMVWHLRFGYAVFALLAFRLVWGFVGGRWSRFASFLYSPADAAALPARQGRSDEHLDVGHTPLGSASVFAMLLFLSAQVASGLFADDEIATTGPLNKFVSGATGLLLTGYHKHDRAVGADRPGPAARGGHPHLPAAACAGDLIGPMISGDKLLPAGVPASDDDQATRALAVMLLTVCAAVVAWLVTIVGG